MSWLRREAVSNHGIVQLPNGKKWLRCKVGYIQCFIADSGTLGCSEPESAGCHLVNVERFSLRPKNKMAAGALTGLLGITITSLIMVAES